MQVGASQLESAAEWCVNSCVKGWHSIYPYAAKCPSEDIDRPLVFDVCPQRHRKTLTTTNRIERPFREIERRNLDATAPSQRLTFVRGTSPWLATRPSL